AAPARAVDELLEHDARRQQWAPSQPRRPEQAAQIRVVRESELEQLPRRALAPGAAAAGRPETLPVPQLVHDAERHVTEPGVFARRYDGHRHAPGLQPGRGRARPIDRVDHEYRARPAVRDQTAILGIEADVPLRLEALPAPSARALVDCARPAPAGRRGHARSGARGPELRWTAIAAL